MCKVNLEEMRKELSEKQKKYFMELLNKFKDSDKLDIIYHLAKKKVLSKIMFWRDK